MTPIKIHGFAQSTYTKTALLVAAETNTDVSLVPLDFKKPAHLALHPYGKMPALEHGKVRLFETLAIADYLLRVGKASSLAPKDAEGHAKMLQWTSVAIDYAYEDLVNQLHEPTDAAKRAAGEQLALLNGALDESPYFAGNTLSLADLFLFPMVEFAVSKLGAECLESCPALGTWLETVANRPSVKNAA